MKQITQLTNHNDRNQAVEDDHFLAWLEANPEVVVFGPVCMHSWLYGTEVIQRHNPRNDMLKVLPDKLGLICFENTKSPNNLVILDGYGNEKMRLTVPWQMTGKTDLRCGEYPTSFSGLSEPYNNPATGEEGKYGVKAHVNGFYGQAFYFEFDYLKGVFLWCYLLERG
jgi:hypothetical protein